MASGFGSWWCLLGALGVLGCSAATPVVADAGRDMAAGGASDGAGGGGGASTARAGIGGAGSGSNGLVGSDCRRDADCATVGARCLAPGESPGCGICQRPISPCSADLDCAARGATWICDLAPCSCADAKGCVPGCVDGAACAEGQSCSAVTRRCVNDPCTPADHGCLPDFVCGGDSRCVRKNCTTDADCAGACVKGSCYVRPGTCTPPMA